LQKQTIIGLENVENWLKENQLALITKKNSFHKPKFNVSIMNRTVSLQNSVKYLEVLIDNQVNWQPQINYLAKKLPIRKTLFLASLLISTQYSWLGYCQTIL